MLEFIRFIDRTLGPLVVVVYKKCAGVLCVLKEGCLNNILGCH